MAETQEQFDWMQDSAKCVEGLKFDLEKEYTFDLIYEEVSKHPIKRGSGDDAEVITYKKGDKKGQPVLMYTIPFRERETNVTFKLDFFANDSYRVNPENPELEDDIVKFSRKLGYSPVVDGSFSLADFIKPGLVITAMLAYQQPTKAGEVLNEARGVITDGKGKDLRKAYTTISIPTINVGEEGSGGTGQTQIEDVPADIQAEVHQALKESKAKKFSELSNYLSKKKKFPLIEAAIRMKEQGLLKVA